MDITIMESRRGMSEYIKREDALDMHFSVGLQDDLMLYVRYAEVKDNIEHIPAADVVEVVRCKDCKWRYKGANGDVCDLTQMQMTDNDYCSWGEQKEQKHE